MAMDASFCIHQIEYNPSNAIAFRMANMVKLTSHTATRGRSMRAQYEIENIHSCQSRSCLYSTGLDFNYVSKVFKFHAFSLDSVLQTLTW